MCARACVNAQASKRATVQARMCVCECVYVHSMACRCDGITSQY